jgi:alpha-L-fucosidase
MDLIGHEPKNGAASIEMFFTSKMQGEVAFLYVTTVGYPHGRLIIRDIAISSSTQVHMLGQAEQLLFEYDGSYMAILVPLIHPALLPCNHAYSFRISHAVLINEAVDEDL